MKSAMAASGWVLVSSVALLPACAGPATTHDDAGRDAVADGVTADVVADAAQPDAAQLDATQVDSTEIDSAEADVVEIDSADVDAPSLDAMTDAARADSPVAVDAHDARASDVPHDTMPPPDAGAAAMMVGLNAGGWGPGQPADVLPAVSVVRLDSERDTDVASYTALGMKVIVDFSGPYNTGGVRAIDATTWTSNAVSYYAMYCGGSRANCPAIEVLNEPSGSWFWGSGSESAANEAAYAHLLHTVHDAFVARFGANAPAILGSFENSAWWSGVVAADAGVGGYVDGVVVHPYGGTGSMASSALGNRSLVTTAHTTTGKPVWITEVGWPTAVGRPSTGDSLQWTEAQQADNVYNFVNWARSTGYVAAVTIFGYRDYGTNNWYGVERWGEGGSTVDGSRKPAYRALHCAALGMPESC